MNPQSCLEIVVAVHLVLLAAWGCTLLAGKRSAAARHAIWTVAFGIVLIIPLVRLSGAVIQVGIANNRAQTSEAVLFENVPAEFSPVSEQIPTATEPSVSWLGMAGFAWLAGTAVATSQIVAGVLFLAYLRRRKSRQSLEIGSRFDRQELSAKAGLKRFWDLRVCLGPRPPTAMTWGIKPPVVLLPEDSLVWPNERLEAVMLHELAHVRRLDSLTQFGAVLVCALYWFSPVPWLCARAMRSEAESAADQAVIGCGVAPSDYAEMLIRLAKTVARPRQPFAFFGVSIMNKSRIEKRVASLLSPSTRRGATATELLATSLIGLLVLAPLALLKLKDEPQEPARAPAVAQSGSTSPAQLAPSAPQPVSATRASATPALAPPVPDRAVRPAQGRRSANPSRTAPVVQGAPASELARLKQEVAQLKAELRAIRTDLARQRRPASLSQVRAEAPLPTGAYRPAEGAVPISQGLSEVRRDRAPLAPVAQEIRSGTQIRGTIAPAQSGALPRGTNPIAPSLPSTARVSGVPLEPGQVAGTAPSRPPLTRGGLPLRGTRPQSVPGVQVSPPTGMPIKKVVGRGLATRPAAPARLINRSRGTQIQSPGTTKPIVTSGRVHITEVRKSASGTGQIQRIAVGHLSATQLARDLAKLKIPGLQSIVVDERSNTLYAEGTNEALKRVSDEVKARDK